MPDKKSRILHMKRLQSIKNIFPNIPEKQGRLINAVLYFIIVSALLLAVTFLTDSEAKNISAPSQFTNFDFSSHIALLSPEIFERYADVLYSPEDFATGSINASTEWRMPSNFATYRPVLNLQEGVVYGLSGFSATHAMTLWVDGVELLAVGVVGDSLESMSPAINHFTIYFVAQGEQTEILIQRSGFVHARGGQLYPLFLGRQHQISSMNNINLIRTSVSIGVMLAAAFIFLGIFIFFKKRIYLLWFALACLTTS